MAEVAADLTDEVIPHLPVRQWVLSVPKRVRPFLHQTPEVASAVLAIFIRALRSALRDASPGATARVRDVQVGAISFITMPSTVERILLHLDLPHRPPRLSPTRGPPQAEFDLDQSPAFDLAAPEPIPEFEFDQSPPQDWEA